MSKNLVLLGMMGVGKTTLGKAFANKHKLSFLDTDARIEEKNSMSVNEIFKKKGEKFFRQEEEKIVINSLNEKNCILALGGGAFVNPSIRDRVLSLAISIWLDMDIKLLSERLESTFKRPLLKNEKVEEKLLKIYQERKNIYNLANYKINCDKLSIKKILLEMKKIYESQ